MKHRILLCSLQTLLCLSMVFAQETRPRIGLGVSLNPTALLALSSTLVSFVPVGLSNIFVPIELSKEFRIEPEFGILTTSDEHPGGTAQVKSSSSLIRLGIGVLRVFPVDDSYNLYVGPRLGLLLTSSTSQSGSFPETGQSETDFYVGLVTGGEHMFSSHFSMGGEVQLNYVSFGTPTYTPSSPTGTQSRSMFTNNALMFFRWYF
jgi:hypothetical protein